MSWIPETRIDANIITAAPPSTDCGIMDTNAAIFGQSPQRIRKMAPQESAIRFTIFVIEIMPTFCAKEVFPGRDKRFFFIVLPGIRRELPVEGSAGKMSENTRNIQNDGKSTKNPSIDKRITKKKKSRLTINFKIVYKIDNMN